jgi:NAD(P)-dependent dehydrogenase (short-subunit alcohol dehydrogenase family)
MTDPNRILLITGGSRGIGATTAAMAAREGYDVAISYVSDEPAASEVVRTVEAAGRRALAVRADVAVDADVDHLFRAVDDGLGRLTHLVNNAGVTGRSAPLDAADPAVIRRCIDVNVTGAILVAQAAVRRMARRHGGSGGSIVNISSIAAGLGSPGEYVWYAASKGAIDSLTTGMAKEWAGEGIRVNAVSPGMVMTDIHDRSTGDVGRIERIRPSIPMRRIGEPQEIAASVLFLLSDASSYTTGANLVVGGGR